MGRERSTSGKGIAHGVDQLVYRNLAIVISVQAFAGGEWYIAKGDPDASHELIDRNLSTAVTIADAQCVSSAGPERAHAENKGTKYSYRVKVRHVRPLIPWDLSAPPFPRLT